MDNLDGYIGAVIDIDGARYRLAGLDWPDALLADLDPDSGIEATGRFVRQHIDDVAAAMVLVIRNHRDPPATTGNPGTRAIPTE